jgi:predicted nucleic-acid-binding protein
MIGLDTNILVRYLTHDDPLQTVVARTIIQAFSPDAPGFISMVVIVELIWVLQSAYGFEKDEIERVLETLLRSKDLVIEQAESVSQALRAFRPSRADFSDCLIERIGYAAKCQYTVTFDQNAAATAGMRLLV